MRDSWLKTLGGGGLVLLVLAFCFWCVTDPSPPPKVAQFVTDADPVIALYPLPTMNTTTMRRHYEEMERREVAYYEQRAKGVKP